MSGEHSYSTEAVQVLCDHYYTHPGTRVEDIRGMAARGELPNTPAHIQAEIALISRAQCFELLRQDPRHTGTQAIDTTIDEAVALISQRVADISKQGAPRGWGQIRELDRCIEALDGHKARQTAQQPAAKPSNGTDGGILSTLTRKGSG